MRVAARLSSSARRFGEHAIVNPASRFSVRPAVLRTAVPTPFRGVRPLSTPAWSQPAMWSKVRPRRPTVCSGIVAKAMSTARHAGAAARVRAMRSSPTMPFRAGQARRGLTTAAGRSKVQAKPAAEQGAAKAPVKPKAASKATTDAASGAGKQTPSSLAAETAKIADADAASWGMVWPVVRSWRLVSARLKELWTRYGWLTIITWFGMYNVVLWGIFAARRTGVFKGMESEKVQKWLNDLSLKKQFYGEEPIVLSPVAIDFLVAWLLVKTTEPLRAIIIIMLVPMLVRRLPPWVLFRLGAKNIPGKTGGPGM